MSDKVYEHDWHFYMNGTFCHRCGQRLGTNQPCKR